MPRRPKDRSEYEGYDPVVTSPEPIERSEEEGYDPVVTMPRQDYKGFQMPSGMSLPQRRKWKRSIDVRESGAGKRQEARDDADTEALKQGIIDRTKDVGAAIKGAAEGVGDVIKAPFEYRAALATDPAGTMAATKEFGSRVMSGDPEARRQAAEGVSMSTVEPFATAADAELARQDLAKGDYAGAAISGASVLLPFVSAGWLKTAMRKGDVPSEAAEKVAELERRVDAGEVTDDMQIRREIAMIEDDHAIDYAKSRPVEDPMQQGMSRPRADVDPDAAYEFDREPPGYMAMSRSNQPMSRFSEGHARFIDELRTDMAEDTNFGELSSSVYDQLLDIDKREDLLRSTGKDARGRQLDDIEISNEYETLSKERHSLANEYYVGKAEREAELRYEGSYVPPGSKTTLAGEPVGPPGGKPPGGGSVARSVKDQADEMQSELERMSYAGQMESEGRLFSDVDDLVEDFARKYPEDVYAEVARRIKAGDTRGSETFYEIADPDDYLPSGGGKPPGGGAGGLPSKIKSQADDLESELAQLSDTGVAESGMDREAFAEDTIERARDELFGRIADASPEVKAELIRRYRSGNLDRWGDGDGLFAEFGFVDDPSFGKPPGGGAGGFKRDQLDRTERMGLAGGDPKLASPKFGLKDQGHHNVVEDLGPLLPEDRNLLGRFAEDYNLSETELRQLRDEYVAYGYDDFPGRSARGFEEIDIPDDLPGGGSEGPSEAEIQAMVNQRFGDPNELEMMKEDMRRMAGLMQDEQIAQAKKNRVRRSRTPGAPGATEGSVKRERPMPKAKKGKYEN